VRAAAAGALIVAAVLAQDTRRHFEVASIKPNHSGKLALQGYDYRPGGRFVATNATLVDVIVRVYPTRRIQMQGGPAWIDSERFDFEAKADASEGQVRSEQWTQMVQTMLEDRFKLAFHTEEREMTVLALTVGKADAKLTRAKDDGQTAMTPGPHGQMTFTKMPIVGLVNTMANVLHTPVVDRTGLTGFYDFTIDPNNYAGDVAEASKDSFGELMAAAVRDQLGLVLEKGREKLTITIIDHAERPLEN
jgi:uncharacterized protein (TIGR03435 family)